MILIATMAIATMMAQAENTQSNLDGLTAMETNAPVPTAGDTNTSEERPEKE